VQLANSRGAAHARIQLRPAELGGLMIRLKSTAEGMVATIKAERPEAAAALEKAAGDLRRTLEDRGITLVSLDVSIAADSGGSALADRRADAEHGAAGSGRGRADTTDSSTDDDDLTAAPAVRLPAGALVDVHA
jgi:flagellar hook-length control protein FliK